MKINIPIVILCGGKGLRMKGPSNNLPKTLIHVNHKPLIQIKLEKYSKQGFKNFIVCLGYQGNMIKKFLQKDQFKHLNIIFVNSGINASMLKRIHDCKKYINGIFILTYGDTISNINLLKILKHHYKKDKNLTMVISLFKNPYGVINFNCNNDIVSFEEKPINYNFIGYSIMNVESLNLVSKKILDLHDSIGLVTFLKMMINLGDASSYVYNGLQLSFNTQSDIKNDNFVSL